MKTRATQQSVVELEVGSGDTTEVVRAEVKMRRVLGRRAAVSVVLPDGLAVRFQLPLAVLEEVCRELEWQS